MADDLTTEAQLIEAWLTVLRRQDRKDEWTVYPETAGWDLLLQHRSGFQVGIEAKLTLNAKVLQQALDGTQSYWSSVVGPDFRAVLVPEGKLQHHLTEIAKALGVIVLVYRKPSHGVWYGLGLPDEEWGEHPHWCPVQRCPLPEYMPDVAAGVPSPVQLSHWKIKAIKLLILLERRGSVSRADMKALQISPTRWTDRYHGFLSPSSAGYVRNNRTPDLKAQHPQSWAAIEADYSKWAAEIPNAPLIAAGVTA